jgi:hypothetical protein
MPALQQQWGKDRAQREVKWRLGVVLLPEHAQGNHQAEEVDRIEPRHARQPEAAGAELAATGTIGVVVGEDES